MLEPVEGLPITPSYGLVLNTLETSLVERTELVGEIEHLVTLRETHMRKNIICTYIHVYMRTAYLAKHREYIYCRSKCITVRLGHRAFYISHSYRLYSFVKI